MAAEPDPAADSIYLLAQRFSYAYATPVRHLRHRLVVVPRAVHGHQRRLSHRVTVSGSPALVSVSADGFGNHVVEVRAAEVTAGIEFESWAVVGRDGPGGETTLPPAAIGDARLLGPTALTRTDTRLADAARELAAGGAGGLGLAERACSWAHAALAYEYGVTGVRTAAADALAGGRGVCQDYAHVMLAVCRCAGLPARYVSGHLVGEGGSHAWVEVVVADPSRPGRAVAVAFDPTHDRRAGRGYLTVAVGRDYADVAPTSGTFEGDGPGVLSGRKRLSVVGAGEPGPVVLAAT
ncbi:MAG: transglutaminase domain-containing protein [Acidimicrobiales bacterium]